jgi:hypothetical protein
MNSVAYGVCRIDVLLFNFRSVYELQFANLITTPSPESNYFVSIDFCVSILDF